MSAAFFQGPVITFHIAFWFGMDEFGIPMSFIPIYTNLSNHWSTINSLPLSQTFHSVFDLNFNLNSNFGEYHHLLPHKLEINNTTKSSTYLWQQSFKVTYLQWYMYMIRYMASIFHFCAAKIPPSLIHRVLCHNMVENVVIAKTYCTDVICQQLDYSIVISIELTSIECQYLQLSL